MIHYIVTEWIERAGDCPAQSIEVAAYDSDTSTDPEAEAEGYVKMLASHGRLGVVERCPESCCDEVEA